MDKVMNSPYLTSLGGEFSPVGLLPPKRSKKFIGGVDGLEWSMGLNDGLMHLLALLALKEFK
jgi:hypothetical protein